MGRCCVRIGGVEASRDGVRSLSRRQNTGSEVRMSLADKIYGNGNALVETLSALPLGIDDMAEFVLRVALWCRRDSFI